jgi:hypothetical protein
MIELCIFPKGAIEDAERAIVTKKDIKSLWHLYFGMCKTYCKDMGIAIDYGIITRLFMEHGVDQNEPRLLNDIVNKPAAANPKKLFTQHALSEDEVEERKRATRERHEQEMNEWKVSDPDKYNRIRTREAEFRKILGLNEDGTPVDPANPPSLAKLVALMTGADEASVQGGEAPKTSNNGIILSTNTIAQSSLDTNPYTKDIL